VPTSPKPPQTPPPRTSEERNGNGCCVVVEGERRHSKEDGSDSSKDSSLQSDTSVDSEDSFASVIFIPKPDQTSPPLNTSPTTSSAVPGSPKFKYQSPPSLIIKQPSLPCKTAGPTSPNFSKTPKQHSLPTSPKFKYQMPPLSPGFLKSIEKQKKLAAFLQNNHSGPISPKADVAEEADVDSSSASQGSSIVTVIPLDVIPEPTVQEPVEISIRIPPQVTPAVSKTKGKHKPILPTHHFKYFSYSGSG